MQNVQRVMLRPSMSRSILLLLVQHFPKRSWLLEDTQSLINKAIIAIIASFITGQPMDSAFEGIIPTTLFPLGSLEFIGAHEKLYTCDPSNCMR